jgi:nickel-dependent lactate racemase
MELLLRYGSGEISVPLPQGISVPDIFIPNGRDPLADLEMLARKSLMNPVGSAPLVELVPSGPVVVVVDDITRPVPTSRLLPILVELLVETGIRMDDISVIVATGLHRALGDNELQTVLGPLAGMLRISNHDPYGSLKAIGRNTW